MSFRDDILKTAKELGVEVDFEGTIVPGSLYLAKRNNPTQILTCKYIKDNYIVPVEDAYPFDVWECALIK